MENNTTVKVPFWTIRRRDILFYCLILAEPLLHMAIFYIYLNLDAFSMAFQDIQYDADALRYATKFVAFDNFKMVINDLGSKPVFLHSFRNSLTLYFVNLVTGGFLTILFSYYIYKKMPGSGLFKVMLYLPSVLSGITVALTFKYFADVAFPQIYQSITGKQTEGLISNPNTTYWTLVFYGVWIGFGGKILMYLGTMNAIPDSVAEAAALDGVSPLQEFYKITIPMIWPTFVMFFFLGVGGIFGASMSLYEFFQDGASYDLYTFGYYMFINVKNATRSGYPYLAAFGLLETLIATPLMLTVRKLLYKFGPSVD